VIAQLLRCPPRGAPNQQLLEVSFSEAGGSKTVTLTNSRISNDERRDSQEEGWHACLDELARLLKG
jgi:uncharacterized protein YndB with AHSA1/START domain